MYCTKCGTQLSEESKFCVSCGEKQHRNNKSSSTFYTLPKGQYATIATVLWIIWFGILIYCFDSTDPSGLAILSLAVIPGFLIFYHLGRKSHFKKNIPSDTTEKIVDSENTDADKIEFYSIHPVYLFILSLFTGGLFEIYWHIRNWRAIKEHDKSNISSFWRGIFGPLFSFSLFKRIFETAKSNGNKGNPQALGTFLALVYLISTFIAVGAGRMELAYYEELPPAFSAWIIASIISLIPIVIVQNSINDSNFIITKQNKYNAKFGAKEIVLIIIGVAFFLLSLFGWLSQAQELQKYSESTDSTLYTPIPQTYTTQPETQLEPTLNDKEQLLIQKYNDYLVKIRTKFPDKEISYSDVNYIQNNLPYGLSYNIFKNYMLEDGFEFTGFQPSN